MPKLIASDVPQTPSTIKPLNVQQINPTDTTQQSQSIAGQAISSTGQFLQSTLQQQARTAQTIMQSSGDAAVSVSQSESQKMTAQGGGNSFAKGLQGIAEVGKLVAGTLSEIEKRDKAAKTAYEKQQYDIAHAAALQEVSVLQADAQDRMINGVGGRVSVERDFQAILGKYALSPDDKAKVVNDFYGTIIPLEGKNAERLRAETDKIEDQKLDVKTKQLGVFLSTSMSQLSVASTPAQVDEQVARFDDIIQKTVTDNSLSPKERQGLLVKAFSMLETATFASSDTQAKARAQLENYSQYSEEASLLATEYKNTGDRGVYDNKMFLLQQRYGISDKYADTYDPDKARRDLNQIESDKQNTETLRKSGEAILFDNTEFGDLSIGNMANGMATDPGALAKFKASANGKTTTGQQVIAIAELADKQRQDMLKLREYGASIEVAKQNILKGNIGDLISFIKASKPDKPNPLLSVPSIAAVLTTEVMSTLRSSQENSPEYKAALKGAYDQLQGQSGVIINALDEQIRAQENTVSSQARQLERYGWKNGQYNQGAYDIGTRKQEEALQKQQAQQQAERQAGNGGNTPSFRAPTLKTANVDGKTAYLPLNVSAQLLGRSNNFGENRGTHDHAGEDIQVPSGTPVVSPMDGKVSIVDNDPTGYGYWVEVKYPDGTRQRFGHLTKQLVHEGQTISAGQVIGKSGGGEGDPGRGRSTGAHLHWEVRDKNGNPINPYSWATTYKPNAATRKARSGDVQQTRPANIPKDALPMAGGYLVTTNGRTKFYSTAGISDVKYSSAAPIRANQNSTSLKDYPKRNNPNGNYGYSILSQDRGFARELARVSDKMGIPAQWLADVMAFETGGTFDPSKQNIGGAPAFGLIQFYDDADRPGGKTIGGRWYPNGELRNMSRVQQMKLVEQYLEPFKGQMREPGHVLEAIFGGSIGRLRDSDGDGDIKFGKYKERLGEHAGRRYYGAGGSNRQARALGKVDTKYNPGCTLCTQMLASSGSIIPHERVG